jgi:amino acid adenylation domain-containing protein
LLVLLPEHDDARSLKGRWPQHVLVCAGELEPAEAFRPGTPGADSLAYLLFTSGSTGTPKGVMVAQRNVRHFVDAMVERYGVTEQDRFSQTFDLTFDLSAFDMFVAWERGACLCRPSQKTLLNPGRFIQESKLTVWFSVPSVGVFMKRLGMLKPDIYPTLRWSLFCGEPLPAEIASAWAHAAPNSIVENLYGPTELTIACTVYRWDAMNSPSECNLGVVPIGWPYPGMEAIVVNDSLQEVAPGLEGELLMAGPQRCLGYWQDAVKTAAAFVNVLGRTDVFYRTGDRVLRPVGANPLVYLGRLDDQVKIQGYRVELGEVEAHLRQEANVEAAVALGWPVTPSGPTGIVAFVGDTTLSVEELRARLRTKLPGYAVPREIRMLPQLPLNANGKVDRNALLKLLEGSA